MICSFLTHLLTSVKLLLTVELFGVLQAYIFQYSLQDLNEVMYHISS